MNDCARPPYRQECLRQGWSVEELKMKCMEASNGDGQVVIATRIFPSDTYRYFVDKYAISIACARLNQLGYSVDSKIVMNEKCSNIVLCVENQRNICREVHAVKLPRE